MLQEELYNERDQEDETAAAAAVRDPHMFHANHLRLFGCLKVAFGILDFAAQEVIEIEIMRRRRIESDVSTFCVCEVLL